MTVVDSWAASLYRSVRNILPWPQFTPFTVRPPLRLEPMMTDDDCEFHSDMLYFRALRECIENDCIRAPRSLDPFPAALSTALDAALILVAHDFAEVMS